MKQHYISIKTDKFINLECQIWLGHLTKLHISQTAGGNVKRRNHLEKRLAVSKELSILTTLPSHFTSHYSPKTNKIIYP